jgi:uncharacterized protein YggE
MKGTKLICITLLLAFFVQTQIFPPGLATNNCCQDNTIKASGEGKASGQPDMAVIGLRFSEKGLTSVEAVKKLSEKVNQAISILKANGYDSSSYETGSLNVYPEYSYQNGKSEIIGQSAQQSLTVRVKGIDAKGTKVGTLVDALAQVNGINIDSVSFDIFNKTPLQTKAREAAFLDAKNKAVDYALFSGLLLGRVINIDDAEAVSAPPLRQNVKYASALAVGGGSSTSVPVGAMEISYSTTVTFSAR